MHGERDGRVHSSPSPSMFTDEANRTDVNTTGNAAASSSANPSAELAYLPIGCSVSAKYRGAFCSAQVKTIEKQVKLKVTLIDSNETITIPEEQIVHQSAPPRIGNVVTIRLNPSNRRQSNDSNSHPHYSRSGLAAFIPAANNDEKQATIKQIIDNSLYTVVFNDGDEKSLRRSSLCLQGVRLYQTQVGQPKILEENPPTSLSPPPPTATSSANDNATANANDIASIVAIQRQSQPVFPALVLKRKALPDYMWVRSFLDGREYIVHARDDVQTYQNNPEIQAACRTTSKQAAQACEKYIKCNQIPAVWQKKRKNSSKDETNRANDDEHSSEQESSSNESEEDDDDDDDDDTDEETTEEKDSFVAQLFAFMDDRGTPINNIPKVQNYDLDLHRLFKLVRLFGGYNKVTKNDQWGVVHMKMGLPDETSGENGRSIESAYKKYLFAYEDLSKKLGSMNAPSAYFGGRTSMGSESRRSLIRVRQQQQEDEKNAKKVAKPKSAPAPVKQRSRKSNESRPSVDAKATASTTKKSTKTATPTVNRKGPTKTKTMNVLSSSSSSSESDSSDEDSSSSDSSNYDETQKSRAKSAPTIPTKKPAATPSTSSSNAAAASSSSNVNKKLPQPSSNKSEPKKTTNTSKPSTSTSQDAKSSKLTLKFAVGDKAKTPNNVQTVKKPPSTPMLSDEKRKLLGTKNLVAASPKKPISTSTKTSQIVKPTTLTKQSSTDAPKSSLSSSKTSLASSILSSSKTKPNPIPSTSNANNKDRSVSKSSTTSASSIVKPTKLQPPATKSHADERSNSVPMKKPKPLIKEEIRTKTIASPSTMKIPKLSSSNDPTKKLATPTDKIPKKQISKDQSVKTPKPAENSSTKPHADPPSKSHAASPTRLVSSEVTKKAPVQDLSPITTIPRSPSPVAPLLSSISSISEEAKTPVDVTPEVKVETPLIFHPIPITIKEANEQVSPSSISTKRPHPDDQPESNYVSSATSDIDEQLSPLKRIRRSMSSQESLDTLSNEPTVPTESMPSHRSGQLTYDEIAINDVLLVTWGLSGAKSYPARCIGKNDEKNELFVHYIKYNPRHDEWIKLDRVIERNDSNNTSNVLAQRQRRTSQLTNVRQQHLDSTTSSSSTTISSSNEPIQSILVHPSRIDLNPLSSSADDDESTKDLPRRISMDKAKISSIEESDLDDNSQENHRSWTQHLEPISSTDDDVFSSTSTRRTSQSDLRSTAEDVETRRNSTTIQTENILTAHRTAEFLPLDEREPAITSIIEAAAPIPQRRQSRLKSLTTKQIEPIAILKAEHVAEPTAIPISEIIDQSHDYPHHVKEETIDHSSIHPRATIPITLTLKTEPVPPSTNILASPPLPAPTATTPSNRRAPPTRQSKRRSTKETSVSKDAAVSVKKKTKFENGNLLQTETSVDSLTNNESSATRSNSTEQQISENSASKRNRPVGRRGGKRSTNQQEYENEDYRSNSPSYVTMRQQLKEMFKQRPSRYNFLDLNNNLTGDERITHLKDRMRECQKVFFNLKSALMKIEKQRQAFLRKQKPLINVQNPAIVQTSSTEILATPTCT